MEALPPGIAHTLPDVLTLMRGGRVTNAGGWAKRRAELLTLFEKEMYGPALPPQVPEKDIVRALPSPDPAVSLRIERWHLGPTGPLYVIVSTPTKREKPAPVFIGLDFEAVETILTNPPQFYWAFVEAAKRGFGIVVGCYEEVAPDQKSAPLYKSEYRAVSLWAWALSRLADGVEKYVPELDPKRLAAVGHSRLGKTALLAGARDTRFALTIPSQSGCGCAAPSRGSIGESVERINTVFPHWFNDRFKTYNKRPEKLPFDQHALLACIAPRALLICNAADDTWANPTGQTSALEAARPVWSLLGADPAQKTSAFLRPGGHAMSAAEWTAYLDFAEKVL
jgi:hypothetical protein